MPENSPLFDVTVGDRYADPVSLEPATDLVLKLYVERIENAILSKGEREIVIALGAEIVRLLRQS